MDRLFDIEVLIAVVDAGAALEEVVEDRHKGALVLGGELNGERHAPGASS